MKKSSTDVRGSKMPRCFVQRCPSSGRKKVSPNVVFHVFPNRLEKIRSWLQCIEQSGQDLGNMDHTAHRILEAKRGERYRICSAHFTEDCYVPGGLRKTLKRDAVPSVFQGGCEEWGAPPSKRLHADPFMRRQRKPQHVISPLLRHRGDTAKSDTKVQAEARARTDRTKVSDNLFNLTLEIMCLLTGEDCMVVKKTSGERVAPVSSPHISGGPAIMLSPINKQKILELTFRVIYQLTGEDPEDATVSFCMEKEENSGGWDKGLVVAPHKEASPDPFVKNLPRYKVGPIKEEPPINGDDDPVLSEDAEGGAICIKEEPDITHLQFYTRGNSPQQYPFVIKSELDGDDGERSEASSAGYVQNASVQIKEEPMSYEEGNTTAEPEHPSTNEYTSFQIKDESMSDEEGNFADADEHRITERRQYGPYGSEEETDSCGEGTSSETDVFSPVDPYPSAHSDPAPALYGDNHLQQDFLIFGEGSSFDTDVSALIKHAQTKYSFAPIEEVSDEGEAVASPKPHLSKDRPQPKSSGTDEAAGEEGSASQVKKDYKCSECSEIFVRRSDFANHRRDHRRERLTCPECGKLFSNKPSLLNHLTGHTGEKPYSCSICGKCFTRNSNLIVHQAIHMERSPLGTRNVGDFHYVKQILSLE